MSRDELVAQAESKIAAKGAGMTFSLSSGDSLDPVSSLKTDE